MPVLNLAAPCNSPDRSTKSTRSAPKLPRMDARSLPASVNKGFQVLFHSPPGVLFTFPSRYCCTIGHQVVFRLGGWSPRLPTGFLVSRGTQGTARVDRGFAYGAFTLFGRLSQSRSATAFQSLSRSPTTPAGIAQAEAFPRRASPLRVLCSRLRYPGRFGLFPVRSPLLGESLLFSFPAAT